MGQQQLLLLVLATVIVGLATVAGINAFEQNQKQATADAMTQEAMRIASDIQAIRLKPEQMGGITDLTAVSFTDLGQYDTNGSDEYVGPNGTYSITDGGGTACEGNIDPSVEGLNSENGVSVCVEISGTGSDEISTNTSFDGGGGGGS
jgi:hypothetical protein